MANATVNALVTVERQSADYVCNPGFFTVDSKRIECDSNGKWIVQLQKNDTLPTCTTSPSGIKLQIFSFISNYCRYFENNTGIKNLSYKFCSENKAVEIHLF